MSLGKNRCRILKEIRQKIADENDIPFVTQECTYQGECSGTCPKCEEELRYLEQQLERRRKLGKAVVITAVCAGGAALAIAAVKDSVMKAVDSMITGLVANLEVSDAGFPEDGPPADTDLIDVG